MEGLNLSVLMDLEPSDLDGVTEQALVKGGCSESLSGVGVPFEFGNDGSFYQKSCVKVDYVWIDPDLLSDLCVCRKDSDRGVIVGSLSVISDYLLYKL